MTSQSGWREALRVWGLALLLIVAGFALALSFAGPAPPRRLVLATGNEQGAYHAFGQRYAEALAEYGIELRLESTHGSMENVELLRAGRADLALVQGGSIEEDHGQDDGGTAGPLPLAGVASLYYEPLWVFHRADLELRQLNQLSGYRLGIGPYGSGTQAVARRLLRANGIDGSGTPLDESEIAQSVDTLLDGRLDALFLVASPESENLQRLMAQEGQTLRLFDFDRHLGYVRRFPFLAHVRLPQGVFDLGLDVPDREVDLVSPTATLVAREDLHPALVPLFIEAGRRIHGNGSVLSAPGSFPAARPVDVRLSDAAREFFERGPSFLYRVLPFRLAASIDRLKILLLPLITLMLPLLRFVPSIYQWRIRSKVYRWYRTLETIERRHLLAEAGAPEVPSGARTAEATDALAQLEEVDREISESVNVPTSYMEELYNLRMHIALVRDRLADSRDSA